MIFLITYYLAYHVAQSDGVIARRLVLFHSHCGRNSYGIDPCVAVNIVEIEELAHAHELATAQIFIRIAGGTGGKCQFKQGKASLAELALWLC